MIITRLTLRVIPILPPGQDTYYYRSFKLKMEEMVEKEMKASKVSKRVARERTLSGIIDNTDDGVTLKELLALSGFETKYPLHCDNCEDEKICIFFNPRFSDGISQCGGCWKHSDMCTFSNMTYDLLNEIRKFPHFRACVPCHRCWREGTLCSKDQGQCLPGEATGNICQREMYACYWEPRDDSFCVPHCDKAHHDDGYQNMVHRSRDDVGSNAQNVARETVC